MTFSCQRRLPLLRHPSISRLFVRAMGRTREKFGIRIYAWVIMPEHVHLLLMPGACPLERPLRSLKLSVSMRVLARWRELDAPILERIRTRSGRARYWQKGGGHDRNVEDLEEFCATVRYIHRNPVERGLVERPEEWRWSSVRWWMGEREREFACDPPPGDPRSWAAWKGFM